MKKRYSIKTELWKPVPLEYPFCDNYVISTEGRLKSIRRNKIMTPGKSKDGYHITVLSVNNKKKNVRIHRLVAAAFLDFDLDGDLIVDHIDNNKDNNMVNNLQAITTRENNYKDRKSNCPYPGVHWDKAEKAFRSQISVFNRQLSIGMSKDDPERLADMYHKISKKVEKLSRKEFLNMLEHMSLVQIRDELLK